MYIFVKCSCPVHASNTHAYTCHALKDCVSMERGDRVNSSGEKLSLSLVILVFMILYLLPGGRGTKSLPSGWVETAAMPLAFFWTQSAYTKSRFGRGLPTIPSTFLTAPSPFCPVSYSCHPKLSC